MVRIFNIYYDPCGFFDGCRIFDSNFCLIGFVRGNRIFNTCHECVGFVFDGQVFRSCGGGTVGFIINNIVLTPGLRPVGLVNNGGFQAVIAAAGLFLLL